jgi:two-component system chemotaxis sensor kinase CheA
MNADLQQQFIRDLLTESFEGLDRYDQAILELEQHTAGADTLNDIFRVVHTLKGTAGCLGFQTITKVAHAGENLLDALRNEQLVFSPNIAAVLLRLSDALRSLLQAIEKTGRDETVVDPDLVTDLEALRNTLTSSPEKIAAPLPTLESISPADLPLSAEEFAAASLLNQPTATPPAPAAGQGWGLFDDEPAIPAIAAAAPVSTPATTAAVASVTTTPATGLTTPSVHTSSTSSQATTPPASTTVRVDVALLDKLMNLVGELVLSRNQLVQLSQSRNAPPRALNDVAQRLNLITSELQEGVMKTRMQPIGGVWGKFPRIVRDVAHELGKQVRLETIGAATELDRTVIESIRDPLTHIIRNSIDHGIESPACRLAAGKPAEGHILMRAYHEGGQVNIEIIDDGAGLNLARIRQKAVEKKLISATDAAALSDREATNLIFLPGFSTAEKVTNVSGRGVGMDVVKTNIEKIGGSVDVSSALGQGTTLKIKIPLTLAIVPALIVRASGERFAIPQVSLLELVRLEGAAAAQALEKVYDAPVFRLRGNLLPLVFLHRELKLKPPAEDAALNIVVLQADQRSFGLVVDTVCDTEEIVVKPLGKHLKGLPMYAGATIMGDGRVALILDALGLAQHARVLSENPDRARTVTSTTATESATGTRTQLLLFSLPGRPRLALPLDQAARLEEFPASSVESSAGREAVQYRGQILPLLRLARFLPGTTATATTDGPLRVIVYQKFGHAVGIVVGQIHDIIEHTLDLQPGSQTSGLLGSTVVQGKITDLVDVTAVLHAAGFTTARAA